MRTRGWFALVTAAACVGCGGGPVPVRGTVTLDGKPMAGATVTFLPEDAAGRQATATTAEDGSFHLTTLAPRDGAMPGAYKVVVQHAPAQARIAGSQREVFEAMKKAPKEKPKPSAGLPPKYSDPGQTVLRQTVPPAGPVVLALDGP
jgi:hypothetical protein